jgi:hypothetical protein
MFDKISVKVTTMVWLALIVHETYMYVQMRMLKRLEKHILQDVSHLVTQTQ